MSETGTRVYELGYILAPTVSEGEVSTLVETLKKAVTAADGEVKGEGNPEFIDLAYQMEHHEGSKKMKYSQGYFGWVKFETTPEAIEGLKKALDGTADLIRYILIKTNVENTVVFKKPKGVALREQAVEEIESEETLDEEAIDDMKEDHEKLPDLALDLEAAPASTEEEATNE